MPRSFTKIAQGERAEVIRLISKDVFVLDRSEPTLLCTQPQPDTLEAATLVMGADPDTLKMGATGSLDTQQPAVLGVLQVLDSSTGSLADARFH